MNDFVQKVAVVTGSTSGIGYACAQELGRRGARVVVNGRTPEGTETAAARLREAGVEAVAATADVTDPEQARGLIAVAAAAWGRLDVLVNCAGRSSVAPAAELPPAEWDAVIALNLSAPFYCAQAAAAHLFERGGVVVNVGSVMGRVGGGLHTPHPSTAWRG